MTTPTRRDTATSESGIAELHEFIHAWADAIAANDVDRMERFVTDDWTLVDVGGQISVDTFHRIVRDGTLRHDTMTHEVTGTRQLSDDIAIITTRCINSGSYQGEPISADEWTTGVVVRTPDGWKCVLTQLTPRRQAVSS